jgi:hypothetical protein
MDEYLNNNDQFTNKIKELENMIESLKNILSNTEELIENINNNTVLNPYEDLLQYYNIHDEPETCVDMLQYFNIHDESQNLNVTTIEEFDDVLQCENCMFRTKDPICLLDHNMIVHEGAFNFQFVCEYCTQEFLTRELLDDHINIEHPDEDDDDYPNQNAEIHDQNNEKDEEDEEDMAITNSSPLNVRPRRNLYSRYATRNGSYECPTCGLKFDTPFYLGEHFTEDHQTYEEQLSLNEIMPETTFPSFYILMEMGTIVFPSKNYIKNFGNKKCSICCKYYSLYNVSEKGQYIKYCDDLDKLDKLDTDVDIYTSSIHKYENDYKEHIDKSDNIKNIKYPLIMACCKNDICHECLKQYLQGNDLKGVIKCPYCTIDHTRYELDYIRIVEIDICDKNAWQKWWSVNDRINILM